MGSRHLGLLTDRGLALYEVRRQGWALIREFGERAPAAELGEYLHRDKPFHLLADLVEMEFRFEQAPALRGADRRALHGRRLAQAFRTTPYRHALPQGRVPGKGGEEKLLLSAITNPDLVEPWIAPLRKHRLPLSGIAGAPALLGPLAGRLAPETPHLLLVAAQGRGGIRISHFHQGELRFSRLVHSSEVKDIPGQQAVEEVARTHQYLLGLRLIERDSPVDVACLVPEDLARSWDAALPPAGSLRFRCVGLDEAVRLAGIGTPQAADSVEDLLIALLVRSGFPNHFAPAAERHGHHLLQLRRGLLAGSGLVAATAAVATAALSYGALEKHGEARLLEAGAAAIDGKIGEIRRSFPETTVPAAEMGEALALARSLSRESAPSRRLLADISRGLEAVPQAELSRLAWIRTDRPEALSGEGSISGIGSAPSATASQPRRWAALVSGDIVGIGNYRQANAAAEAVRDAIRREGIRADVLRYPFDVSPDRELEEDFARPAELRQPFVLRVLWNE